MPNRVLLGLHNGAYRFIVSKPGVDVLGANANQILIADTVSARMVQRIVAGQVVVSGDGTSPVAHANYGQQPYVFYRARQGTASDYYEWPVLNYGIQSRTLTGFTFYNNNTADARVYYWLWVA